MLRAVRFACRLDFMIEPKTKQALAECAPLLDAVARERVGIELEGILSTGHGGDAMLRYPEVICAAVPEFAAGRGFDQRSVYHAFNVYEHIARVLTVAGELALCDAFRDCSYSVDAGRNGESRSRKGRTCQVRVSLKSPLHFFSTPPHLLSM